MKVQRLDKLLAARGFGSRKEVGLMVRKGQVQVQGVTVKQPDHKISSDMEVVVGGRTVTCTEHLYLMLNKPEGVVSASRDKDAQTVIDLVPKQLWREGLFPAGRLDKDTTGFVLITDDGQFAHSILSPKRHVSKTYIATLDTPPTQQMVKAFEQGIALKNGEDCLPAKMMPLDDCRAQVVLWQGMYHQIKRMFASQGATVTALRRIAIGGLMLDEGLPPGECRELTLDELETIKQDKHEFNA